MMAVMIMARVMRTMTSFDAAKNQPRYDINLDITLTHDVVQAAGFRQSR